MVELLKTALVQTCSYCLASTSLRRQEFLQRYGLQFSVFDPNIDESTRIDESPETYVARMAAGKAEAAQTSFPESLILSGDTIVVHDGSIWGKPNDAAEAHAMLTALSGSEHLVYSAYALLDTRTNRRILETLYTRVRFKALSDELVQWYVNRGESLDKAGAYSIQGLGSLLVESIEGSYNNVVGYPIERVVECLMQEGWLRIEYA